MVVDGLMLMTSANDAFALDARTGRVVWHYSRPVTEGWLTMPRRITTAEWAVWR